MGTTSDSPTGSQLQPAVDLSPDITFEDYMAHYAHDFYEWVDGELIKMSPVSYTHDEITKYLVHFLDAYFSLRPIGITKLSPFVMKLDPTRSGREPDLQVILNTNSGQLTSTAMLGPADICIPIVSPESSSRDYGDKLTEYEKGGVKEYWLIDPQRHAALFYRLNDESTYFLIPLDADQYYSTPLLPNLRVHTPTLWQEKLPDFFAIADSIRAMLGE